MIHLIFIIIQPFSDLLWPVDGGIVIQEETNPIRIDMFCHRIKVIPQYNFVSICSDPSLSGTSGPKPCHHITEPLDPLTKMLVFY